MRNVESEPVSPKASRTTCSTPTILISPRATNSAVQYCAQCQNQPRSSHFACNANNTLKTIRTTTPMPAAESHTLLHPTLGLARQVNLTNSQHSACKVNRTPTRPNHTSQTQSLPRKAVQPSEMRPLSHDALKLGHLEAMPALSNVAVRNSM